MKNQRNTKDKTLAEKKDGTDFIVERQYGGCEVTIVFKGNNPEIKEKVLALLLENYQARVSNKLKLEYENLPEKKKAS